MKKVFLLLLILIISCKEKSNEKENANKLPNESYKYSGLKKFNDLKYVTAKSGLIFRDKPNGRKLGKFEFNDSIVITKYSTVFQEVKDGNKIIKGEWLGTEIENKTVYIFGGFLSSNKTKLTKTLIKELMDDNIWVSQDFKNILEESKSFKKAFFYGFSLQLQCSDSKDYYKSENPQDVLLGFNLGEQDNSIYNFEDIIAINSKTLTIKNGDKTHVFFNNNHKTAMQFFDDWFKGSYVLQDKDRSRKLDSKDIQYYSELNIDYFTIDKKIYRVDEVNGSTFELSEIEFTESENEDEKWEFGGDSEYDIVVIKEIGNTATLTKM